MQAVAAVYLKLGAHRGRAHPHSLQDEDTMDGCLTAWRARLRRLFITGLWGAIAGLASGAPALAAEAPPTAGAAASSAAPHFPVRAVDDAWRAALPHEAEAATRAEFRGWRGKSI